LETVSEALLLLTNALNERSNTILFRQSFSLVKSPTTRGRYSRLAGRVVLSLLRRLIANDEPDEDALKDVGGNIFARFDVDNEFEEDVDKHMGELLAFSEELVNEDEEICEDYGEGWGDGGDNGKRWEDDGDGSDDAQPEDGESSDDSGMDVDEDVTEYPVLLTPEQRTALLKLAFALKHGKPNDTLLSLFHNVCITLFTTQRDDAERYRFHLPIESFIIMSNLHSNGTIRSPATAGPELSMLQYWVQFTILRDAMLSEAPISE
jgi:hypothetical protein